MLDCERLRSFRSWLGCRWQAADLIRWVVAAACASAVATVSAASLLSNRRHLPALAGAAAAVVADVAGMHTHFLGPVTPAPMGGTPPH